MGGHFNRLWRLCSDRLPLRYDLWIHAYLILLVLLHLRTHTRCERRLVAVKRLFFVSFLSLGS